MSNFHYLCFNLNFRTKINWRLGKKNRRTPILKSPPNSPNPRILVPSRLGAVGFPSGKAHATETQVTWMAYVCAMLFPCQLWTTLTPWGGGWWENWHCGGWHRNVMKWSRQAKNWKIHLEKDKPTSTGYEDLVFCYQNCTDLLWEKIVLVIEKKFWHSRLKAENLKFFWDH